MRGFKVLALAMLLGWSTSAQASDPVGIYAVIDKVVVEPATGKPERIQIWGAFSLAHNRVRDGYEEPVRGYLYYSMDGNKAEAARNEWNDLQKVAGTGQCVALASRYQPMGKVRKGGAKVEKPDAYPVAGGIYKVEAKRAIAKKLCALPVLLSPTNGEGVAPGKVTLRVGKVPKFKGEGVTLRFEIFDRSGAKETSPAIKIGKKETTWTPRMEVKASTTYTWRVWAVVDKWVGPAAEGAFEGKSK